MISELIKNEATNLNMCEFCQLYLQKQFEGEHSDQIAHESDVSKLGSTVSVTSFVANICPVCLGLCQMSNNPQFHQYLLNQIKVSGYEFEVFNFNFKLPLTLKLRHRFMMNKFRAIAKNSNLLIDESLIFDFDIKLSIKNSLNNAMAKVLQVPCSSTEDFVINLEFKNQLDEEALVQ